MVFPLLISCNYKYLLPTCVFLLCRYVKFSDRLLVSNVKCVVEELYLNEPWYQFLKQRWLANFDSLEKYWMKIKVRYNETGESSKKYEHYPTYYRAAKLHHGHWSAPFYDCYGKVPMWKILYAAPFFGWDSLKARLEFK